MEDFAMFEEVACEEFYGEDHMAELQEILEEAANFQLQEIADAGRAYDMDLAWEQVLLSEFVSTEFEASHVEA
jgi:hypothetical protein